MDSMRPFKLLIQFLSFYILACSIPSAGQAIPGVGSPNAVNAGVPPLINVGGGDGVLSSIQAFDFNLMNIEAQERDRKAREEQQAKSQKMVKEGLISALDLAASPKALSEFNKAVSELQQQHTPQAVTYLLKAVADYPKFVSAHNNLGTGYLELGDNARARAEFETAAKLDNKFPTS